MNPPTTSPGGKLLHVGCGPKDKTRTTRGFNRPEWTEVRFDIDPSVNPDVQGTMTDMSAVASGSCNALFSSHNIEHLYAHEVPKAFAEFVRVLTDDGIAVITCPDLKSIAQLVADDKLTETAYTSPAGPISALDMLYGHRAAMNRGNLFMAHRCGFTRKVLLATLQAAGFKSLGGIERGAPNFDLWVVASKAVLSNDDMKKLAAQHFPVVEVQRGAAKPKAAAIP